MPFTVTNPPKPATNWTASEKEKCVDAANAVLEAGGSEEEAVFACIIAAGKAKSNDNKGSDQMEKRVKSFDFKVKETKEIERDGQKFGIIVGYASTFGNIDRGGDRILSGAFDKTIQDHLNRDRPIRMLFQHSGTDLIGGFFKFEADQKGLLVEGEINLSVQRGAEAFALAKQGVLSDMSIGFGIRESHVVMEDDDPVFEIVEVDLFEVSLVGEPMNQQATINEVKSANTLKQVEEVLRKGGFSQKQSKELVSRIKEIDRGYRDDSSKSSDSEDVVKKIDEAMLCQKMDKKLNQLKGDI